MPDSKLVKMPPPFLFGAAVVVGYLMDRVLNWHIPAPRLVSLAAGAVLAGVGITLSAIVTRLFLRARTPISPRSPPKALVLDGPYRFSRNPDYIGQVLLCTSIGLLLDAPAVLAATIPALLAVHCTIIPREERFLEQRFGDRYREYLLRVRRWL